MKQFEDRGPKEKPQLVKGGLVGQILAQGQVNIEIWQEFPPYAVSKAATCASLLCVPFLLLVTIMLCSLLSLRSSVAASTLNPMTTVSAVL